MKWQTIHVNLCKNRAIDLKKNNLYIARKVLKITPKSQVQTFRILTKDVQMLIFGFSCFITTVPTKFSKASLMHKGGFANGTRLNIIWIGRSYVKEIYFSFPMKNLLFVVLLFSQRKNWVSFISIHWQILKMQFLTWC